MSEVAHLRRAQLLDAAAQLGLAVSGPTADQLLAFLDLLERWNRTYNLTAIRDADQMLTQHLSDCLAVIAPLQRHVARRPCRLLDVGSGGGLPGVVIAAMCSDIDVTCVDTVGKKAAFVQQVVGSLRLRNLHARHARVEQLTDEPFDLITSRAFASLVDFVALTRPHLAQGGAWAAMKGKIPTEELAALPSDIEVFHVEQLHVPGLAAERCLIWMRPSRSL